MNNKIKYLVVYEINNIKIEKYFMYKNRAEIVVDILKKYYDNVYIKKLIF